MMFEEIEWVFIDLGETIFDEEAALAHRYIELRGALARNGISVSLSEIESAFVQASTERVSKQFLRVLQILGANDDLRLLILEQVPWRSDLEKVVTGTPEFLESLRSRYRLGVIANQSPGAEKRLMERGLREYFEFVLGSGDIGVAKPDERIFRLALEVSSCIPERAVMIGDRLDNDIRPAKLLGMKTIRILKGLCASQTPSDESDVPDFTAESLADIERILLGAR